MHAAARAFVERSLTQIEVPRRILDIGGRDVNGHLRDILPPGADYLCIDTQMGRGVDRLADGATFAYPDCDLILCTEVAEHTPKAEAIVANAYRNLRPGGTFILTAATLGRAPHSAVDGGGLKAGEYYANVDAGDLIRWLDPFRAYRVSVDRDAGDIRAIAYK